MNLDIGCGETKNDGFKGIDKRALPGVDFVHDLEEFPWPIADGSVSLATASHVFEHIRPQYSIKLMDEIWRIMEPGGTLAVAVPYPGSAGYWQDPTHCNGWSQTTWEYFDPSRYLYKIYKPKPWEIQKGFPVWSLTGNLEVILKKIAEVVETLTAVACEDINTSERLR